jgi:Recombination endonuclease VII
MFSHSAWHKKRFAENVQYREKIRAAWRRYRETHKEEINERRRVRRRTDNAFRDKQRASKRAWERQKRYREVYGISLADYEAMLERQRGACAICKKSDEALCVDHCHACGKVRGLLCAKCNSALGFCNDSPEHLLAAVAYLQAARAEEPARSMPAIASGKPDKPREHTTGECSIADARHCRCASKAL